MQASKKFAFLVHEPVMLVHYADVWREMGSSNFTIVLTEYFSFDANGNEKLGQADFLEYVRAGGYEVRNIKEIISCGIRFACVVTNHIISGSTASVKPEAVIDRLKKLVNRMFMVMGKGPIWEYAADIHTYLPLQVGDKQIRYMYGADVTDGWSLKSWNNIYNVFLCHGVNDEREIQKRFKGKTFIMGYPRYDRFFSGHVDLSGIRREFGVVGSRKTVLWMPTLGGDYSSIPLFAEPLSVLKEKYNLIVRPHPLSFVQEKDFIGLLEQLDFNIDRNAVRDMNELFSLADVILADHGGTPFSAIFLGKNVIFLQVPDGFGVESADVSYTKGLSVSSVEELKKHLPLVKHQDVRSLENMLDSNEFYAENSKCIEMLFKSYFDSPRGGGAKRVVQIFNELHGIS
nr:CDP-glycerol glycerophosphotransferase family protein [Nitrosomonas nitrosa]